MRLNGDRNGSYGDSTKATSPNHSEKDVLKMGKDTNQMRCGKDYKMLLSYCVTVLLSVMLGVCFIFFPKTIWPFYPFVWFLPVAIILHGLVVAVVNLCRCRWQLFLRNVLRVAMELVILFVVFSSMAVLCAIYNDDDGGECQSTLSITVKAEDYASPVVEKKG